MWATPSGNVSAAARERWAVIGLHVYVGAVWIAAGIGQLRGTPEWGRVVDWPTTLAQYRAAFHAVPWPGYNIVLESLARHAALVARVIPWLNIAIGVVLVAWFAPRAGTVVATAAALVMLVNWMAASGAMPWSPPPPAAFAALVLTVLLVAVDAKHAWTPLRIYVGVCFLLPLIHRIAHPEAWLAEVRGFLGYYTPMAVSWYRPFLLHVAATHVPIFALLVATGEAVVGSMLVVNLYIRSAAALGIFLSLNYWLAKGDALLAVSNDHAFVAGMLCLIAVTPQRAGDRRP